jgi:hypothetical protein
MAHTKGNLPMATTRIYLRIFFYEDIILTIADEIPLQCFDYIINHVFLPPQLPQRAEESTHESTSALLQLLLHCSEAYARHLTSGDISNSPWPAAIKMMQYFLAFETNDAFSAQEFSTAVTGMCDRGIVSLPFPSPKANG